VGSAQSNRQRSVRYEDVELELWELDGDDGSRGGRYGGGRSGSGKQTRSRSRSGESRQSGSRSRTGTGGRNRAVNESRQVSRNNQNIRLYEQRQRNAGQSRQGSQNGNRTAPRQPVRELQVQDIRRYQDTRTQGRTSAAGGYAYRGSARPVQSIKRRKARKRKVLFARMTAATFVVLCLVLIYYLTGEIYRFVHKESVQHDTDQGIIKTISEKIDNTGIVPPEIIEDYIEVNDYSRPGTRLDRVNSIFVHYTANPGTSAAQNRSYFANLALTHERSASAHLIIGYEGELVQCIPLEEQAYAVMTRNEDSISIECCYTSEDGSFTPETYDTLVHTLAWLTDKYDLSTDDILRHYDCGGKKCPVYYVEHEDAWQQLLQDVAAYKDAGDV